MKNKRDEIALGLAILGILASLASWGGSMSGYINHSAGNTIIIFSLSCSAIVCLWIFGDRITSLLESWFRGNRPRIILYGPAFHTERIPFSIISRALGPIESYDLDILSVIVANKPRKAVKEAVAEGLKAEFTCVGNNVSLPWIDARINDSKQPEPGERVQVEFNLGIDKWIKLNLLAKEPQSPFCYMLDNTSWDLVLQKALNPDWKLGPGEYTIRVRIAGVGVREEFECIFINPGMGGPLVVKLVSGNQ